MHRSHLKVGRYFEKSLLAETDPMAPIPTNAGAVMTGGSSTHLVVIGTVRNVDGHEPTLAREGAQLADGMQLHACRVYDSA